MIAYEGHIEELRLIHGSGEKEKETTELTSAEGFRAAFANKGIRKQ